MYCPAEFWWNQDGRMAVGGGEDAWDQNGERGLGKVWTGGAGLLRPHTRVKGESRVFCSKQKVAPNPNSLSLK
jgi:hypothetical protein